MAVYQLNPTVSDDISGVTLTAASGYTLNILQQKTWGKLTLCNVELTTTSAISAWTTFSPGNCSFKPGICLSDWFEGHIATGGGIWLRPVINVSANSSHQLVIMGIL